MNEKYSCVLDAKGFYKTQVLQVMQRQMDDTEAWEVQYYTPAEGEWLVDTNFPANRIHAGASGYVRPRWDDGADAWLEGATAEEITVWELEHPAPEPPPMGELTMTQLAVAELAQTVEDNNTANQLAVAELAEALIGGAT